MRVKSINCTGFSRKKKKHFTLVFFLFFKKTKLFIKINSGIIEHGFTVMVPPHEKQQNAASQNLWHNLKTV